MKYISLTGLLLVFALSSCSKHVPGDFTSVEKSPRIYPDYSGVTIPCNIAPLNFEIQDSADEYLTRVYAAKKEMVLSGRKVQMDLADWKKMLSSNKGKSYSVDVFLKKEGQWTKYKTITNFIAPDAIDEYISYRLIEPSYMSYEQMTTNQRNLTNFEARELYNNKKTTLDDKNAQCINCHSYQNYKTDNMQLHFRQFNGGTVIVCDGKPVKVNLKPQGALSAGVYPAWHPTEKLIAYSVNTTGQAFHSKSTEKVEVVDTKSDIVLYDLKKNELRHVAADPNSLETFPSWAPDGKTLYFVSARVPHKEKSDTADILKNYTQIHYNILRIPFEAKTQTFGKQDTVFVASKLGKSATLPRISPDGKFLLFTMGDFGNFHIWHKTSDLYLMNLQTKAVRPMSEINSPDVDSYHSWSSNGRWIIFSSRREDGSYTRFFITYFGKDGKASKPFVLPQKDPDFNKQIFKSFNIPEFMIEPVKLSVQDFCDIIHKDAKQAVYAD